MGRRRNFLLVLLFLSTASAAVISCGGGGGGGGNGGSIFREPAFFVSFSHPAASDSNSGTRELPFATIQPAIDAAAAAHSTAYVYVAEGTYSVTSGADHVRLAEGISLYGGVAADWSTIDPSVYLTTVLDTSVAGGAIPSPNRAMEAGSGVTKATVVNGFTITGGGGSHSSGFFIHENAWPTIASNVISGGSGTNSFGVLCDGLAGSPSAPVITGNVINGGTGSTSTTAVFLRSSGAQVSGNTILAGGGSSNFGIYVLSFSSPTIDGNLITAGGGMFSLGIENDFVDGKVTVENNTIMGGTGSTFSAGIMNAGSGSVTVTGNLIDGGSGGNWSYGIRNEDCSPAITANSIRGGHGQDSYGIYNTGSDPLISGNSIDGAGTGSTSYAQGMYNISSSPVIINNTIHGGRNAVQSFGIRVIGGSGSNPDIYHNTIYGGEGSSAQFGVYLASTAQGASGRIDNNIIFTQGSAGFVACILEGDANSDPTEVANNDLHNCPILYYDEGASSITSLTQVNSLEATISDNVSAAPAFTDEAAGDWHLTAATPSSVAQGGTDLIAVVDVDADGLTRTAPVSMGAYEFD